MSGIDDGILDKWRCGRAYEQVAVYIWMWHIRGNERGTELPSITHLMLATDRSAFAIGEAKRLLGVNGALIKENGRWVVA